MINDGTGQPSALHKTAELAQMSPCISSDSEYIPSAMRFCDSPSLICNETVTCDLCLTESVLMAGRPKGM